MVWLGVRRLGRSHLFGLFAIERMLELEDLNSDFTRLESASEESGTDVSSKDLNAVSNHLVRYGKTCSDDELDALFRETDELINIEFL